MPRPLKRRGTAMVEAVIALPVLVLVLVAVPYVHGLLAAHQATLAEARRQAWTDALGACRGKAFAQVAVPGGDIATQAADRSGARHANARYSNVLDVPVVGDALNVFVPRTLTVHSNRTVERPKLLVANHAQDSVDNRVDLVCNEPTQDPLEAALEILWSFL